MRRTSRHAPISWARRGDCPGSARFGQIAGHNRQNLHHVPQNRGVSSSTIDVPVNTPFTVKMFLLTTAEVDVPIGGALDLAANCDFAHTASFETEGQAFNVPAGYTVNSASAGVTDNAFLLVPAPSALAMLASAGLFATRRTR